MDNKILDKIRRKLDEDDEYMADCQAYDDMEALKWDLPSGLAIHEWVRKRVSTDAHDILKTATNLFDVHSPKWGVLPRGPEDSARAEEIERWLEWFMHLANQNGDKEPFRLMLKHSTKYNKICAQVEYEPYWLTGKAKSEAMFNPFQIILHNPANVHYEIGKRLRWVAAVSNVDAGDCLDKWEGYVSDSEDGQKIGRAMKQIQALLDDDDDAHIMYVDYTDEKKRWVFAYLADSEQLDTDLEPPDGKEFIEIYEGKNELGFINWAISEGTSDPLLFSLHKGGLWENQNFLDTIADTTIIRRGFFPMFKHTSVSGKVLDVDYSGPDATVELNASDGEGLEVLQPPPLDPGIRELMDRNSQKGASATGLKGLQNVSITGNVQFASIQAMIQVSKSALDPYIRNFEKAAVEIAKLAMLWVHESGDTLTAYRQTSKKNEPLMQRGAKINIGKDDFDPKTLVIVCELMANNPGDDMQRMNVYSQAIQLGLPIPKTEVVERMGWGSGDVMKEDWLKEKMEEMALQNLQKKLDAQLQLEIQQKQMELQQAQQAQQNAQQGAVQPQGQPGVSPPQQGPGGNPAFDMAQGGAGFDPNQGGTPPAMSAPDQTQTATRQAP